MTMEKYKQAIDLIGKKYGLPDFAYQQEIVSDSDKEQVREIIQGFKEKISNICGSIEPGKHNVIIPFEEVITKSLPTEMRFLLLSV